MFDRLFMAELWCNMLLSLFCTVRFVLGMDLFLVSRFLSLGSVSCFFLFFRFRCSLPWLSPGLLPFLLPLLFLFCSPSFFSLLVSFGALWVFYELTVSSVFSPSMIPWFSWNDHVHPEDFQAGHHPQTLESFYQYKTLQWLHLRALHGTLLMAGVIPPRPLLLLQPGANLDPQSCWDNVGSPTWSSMITRKSMDYLFLDLFNPQYGVKVWKLQALTP